MIQNTFLITWRNLLKFKISSVITIVGLAVAIACAVLILLYVRFELSYDKFHSHHENICRVLVHREINQAAVTSVNTSLLLANEVIRSLPEAEAVARLGRSWSGAFRYKEKQFHEPDFFVTDASIADILNINVLTGDLQKTLSSKNLIAITAPTAKKYFGEDDPIGKTLTYTFEESQDYTVGAVIEPMPANSHIHFDLLASVESAIAPRSWSYDFIPTYIRLKAFSNTKDVETKIASLVDHHYPKDQRISLQLQPLKAIHLNSHYSGEFEVNGNMQTIIILSGIGTLLLILASINFMNMATAQSSIRSREVGVRKVFGAVRLQLVRQFMIENMSIIFIAMVLSVVIVEIALPYYNRFTGQPLALSGFTLVEVLGFLFLLTLFMGFFSSLYPAWFMSAYRPADILRGLVSSADSAGQFVRVRRTLIAVQCFASLLLIICVMVMERQMLFLRTKDLGFATEGVAYIRSPQTPINYEEFRSNLQSIPGIYAITYAGRVPGSGQEAAGATIYAEGMIEGQRMEIPTLWVSHDFMDVFNISLKSGRNFSRDFPNDNQEAVLVNEAAARLLWNSEETGKQISFYRKGELQPVLKTQVVGIVKDFHFQSLHQVIQPMVIRLGGYPTYIAFRYDLKRQHQVAVEVDEAWKKISPDWPLELNYIGDQVAGLYAKDRQLSLISRILTMVAITLACFGLFGLSVFTAQRKTKEIGIRKVMGASSVEILRIMIQDFTILVGVAAVFASPVAFILVEEWLSNFAYRIPVSAWIFVMSSAMMLGIALVSVGFQVARAAFANPVESLRNE
jgi:putative ABC transport system permease protein